MTDSTYTDWLARVRAVDADSFGTVAAYLKAVRGDGPDTYQAMSRTTAEIAPRVGLPIEAIRAECKRLAESGDVRAGRRNQRGGHPEYRWRNEHDRRETTRRDTLERVIPLLNQALNEDDESEEAPWIGADGGRVAMTVEMLRRLLTDPRAAALTLDALDVETVPRCQPLARDGQERKCAEHARQMVKLGDAPERPVCWMHAEGMQAVAEHQGRNFAMRPFTLRDVAP